MILYNGHIQILETSGGGLDENGMPIQSTERWSENIQAKIQTNTENKRGTYADGKFTVSAYSIFISPISNISTKKVKINISGIDKGEFAVQRIEVLQHVNRVKITV